MVSGSIINVRMLFFLICEFGFSASHVFCRSEACSRWRQTRQQMST
ncbi:hypothetical protein C4K08_4642 [Pseudomonas chlororaphis subsp. aureofaciens]|nr:hypothetical protein C4K08_4642 [Pseudomonas chlororaphis subsp. aureofaciens]